MIQAVIFDCFGVLTHDGWKQIREDFFVDDAAIAQHFIDIDKAVNAGLMNYDDFIAEITHITGMSIGEVQERLNNAVPNARLFNYIRDELKPHYKIGMLSNAANNWLDDLFEPWQVKLFDEVVLSYEVGAVKPAPIMYNMISQRLGVLPEECLFVDDNERYCAGAEDLSITAVYHQNTSQTIEMLEKILNA